MSTALILLIPVILISLFCVGLVALSRNIALTVRLYFSLAIVFVIAWLTTLLLSNVDSSLTLFFNRTVYVSPILALLFFGLFIDAFYFRADRRFRLLNMGSVAAAVIGSGIALTRLSIASVDPRKEAGTVVGYNVIPGPLIFVVSVVTIFLSVALFARLILAYKITDERKKKPLKLILLTLVLAMVVSITANLFVPLILGGSGLANAITNIAIIIFVTSVAYSVLRYSFLNIRLLVVRSVAYIAVLATLLVLTTGLEVLIFNILDVGEHQVDSQQLFVLALFLSLAALSFSPLRALLAKATAKVFFKDSYEPSDLIGRFNNNLVNNIDIEKLLSSSANLIGKTLKTTFCEIEVEETKTTPQYATETKRLDREAEKSLLAIASRRPSRILVRQLVESSSTGTPLAAKIMEKYDAEAFVALASTNEGRRVGYIVLGPKKNGEVYNKTDTDVLAILANELVLAIQNALRFKEIEKFNITLKQKVEDATRQLRQTNQRLRMLDQTKDDFISMASHQLRTPLTSVKGYVSMVLDGDAGRVNDLQKKLLTQSFLSSQRMVYLISDLLNVSRLRTGKFVIEPVPSNLADVIESEVEQLQETAKGRELTLAYRKPEHFPALMLDENKLRQVIMNFIDNAIYYTPTGGHITVNLVDKPESIEFTVVDDGIGVPKHEQHHLFGKFYRAHNAKRARPDGTGLGLFMAKKVIIAQGGAVIFKSQESKGSTFGFTFPKRTLLPVDKAAENEAKAD